MADNRPALASRFWTRANLLTRLTIAGLLAAVALSLVFGYAMASYQTHSAVEKELQVATKAAHDAALCVDRDFFKGRGNKPLSKDDHDALKTKLQSVANLLRLASLALLDREGRVVEKNAKAAPDWNPDSSPVVKEARDQQKLSASLRVASDRIEAFQANADSEVFKEEGDVAAVKEANSAGIYGIVAVKQLDDVDESVSALRLMTLVESFASAVILLLVLLLVVRREVVGPVTDLSKIVADLARTGELAPARSGLVRFQVNGGHDGADQNELRALVAGYDALLAALERLAGQANAIAKDDLWNQCFDQEAETRGDLAISFRKMVSMLRDLSIRVGRIARGDLTVPASAPGQKEGSLGSAFREMTEKLKLLLDELAGAGSKIDRAARGLQESSRDQASTATEQAAAVTETMATMEELAASSGHIADTAKHVVQLADETLMSARGGQASVTDVGTGMDEIVAASRQGAHRLLDLGEKSRAIGKVAELITGIAERSKILALNAAIEAARAGEAGRGFSVVADEVRSLADHVVESTREIDGLIGQIQSEISAAVLASEEEVKRAEKGRELAAKAQSSLQAITDTASKTTDAARQIELATNQQRSASGQVATAVREVATSSEEVATGAKRVTVSANELAALAHDLQAVINQFDSTTDDGKKSGSTRTKPQIKQTATQPMVSSFDAEALRRG
ncbi:MAG TPA: methyl-accepting chemotaxis protein [Planctomycetota bacterium]|nr:methyl-accepting chemotaxis protein [Planctomycetota bacterium]